MNLKSACLCTLVLFGLGLGTLHAQAPMPSYPVRDLPPKNPDTLEFPPPPPHEPAQLSDWIVGCRTGGCCGPVGKNGPIAYEIYMRTGESVLLGHDRLAEVLHGGWMIEGGTRVLWFNPEETGAWTLDLGLSNTYHSARNNLIKFQLNDILVPDPMTGAATRVSPLVTVNRYNQTFVNVGFGREWYVMQPASCDCGWSWRVGTDVGGRWGTGKIELEEIPHRQDVMGGFYFATHSDLEIPCGCCIFQVGVRLEWDYTWSDILQHQNRTDLQDINLLLNFGVRF